MKFKNTIFSEDYTLISTLSIEEVERRLKANIEPKNNSLFSKFTRVSTKPYEGYFYGNRFEIRRIIFYRNSFLPIITGHVLNLNDLTNIYIEMKPRGYIVILWYLAIVILGVGFASFNHLFQKINAGYDSSFEEFGFGLFVVIFLLDPVAFFKIESKKAKKFLAGLLSES